MDGCAVAGCCGEVRAPGAPARLEPAGWRGRVQSATTALSGRAWLAVAAMLAAVTLWGPSFVATKVALRDMGPLTIAFLRFLVASCVLYPVWRRSREATRLGSATHRRLFAGGLLGVAGYFILENLGVQRTTAGDAALLMAAIPVIALLAEVVWLKQPISLKRGAGIAVSFAGVVLLIGRARAAGGSNRVLGDLLVIAAAFLWAAYSLHGKTIHHVPKLAVVTYEAIYGTLLLAPFALLESPQWRPVSLPSALGVAYLGVMCSAATYLLYNYALKTLAASQVTAFLNLVPVAGAGAAVLLLGEHLQLVQLLGGAVILAGVAISTATAPARGPQPLPRHLLPHRRPRPPRRPRPAADRPAASPVAGPPSACAQGAVPVPQNPEANGSSHERTRRGRRPRTSPRPDSHGTGRARRR